MGRRPDRLLTNAQRGAFPTCRVPTVFVWLTIRRALLSRSEPPLSPKEREVVKSYGGWTAFCESHGLKPWEASDNQEALSIVKALASHD